MPPKYIVPMHKPHIAITIGIPNQKDRLDILQKKLKPIPHVLSNEQLEVLASKLHGYVGADLAALCKEAGIKAIQRCQAIYDLETIESSEQICLPCICRFNL